MQCDTFFCFKFFVLQIKWISSTGKFHGIFIITWIMNSTHVLNEFYIVWVFLRAFYKLNLFFVFFPWFQMMTFFSFHLNLECKKLNNTPKFSFYSRSSLSHPRIEQHYEINNSDTGGRSKEVFVMKQYISIMKFY